MKAVKVNVGFHEWQKAFEFAREMNYEEDTVVYVIDNSTMFIAIEGDCSLSYVKARLAEVFDEVNIETIK